MLSRSTELCFEGVGEDDITSTQQGEAINSSSLMGQRFVIDSHSHPVLLSHYSQQINTPYSSKVLEYLVNIENCLSYTSC